MIWFVSYIVIVTLGERSKASTDAKRDINGFKISAYCVSLILDLARSCTYEVISILSLCF
jgi:hypothetical protein